MNRVQALVRNLDHSRMRGVEIGPWYSPVTPKSGGWKTTVVDFTDESSLRSAAVNHSAESIRAAASSVEVVDVVWRGQALDEACLELNPEGYDYVIASHVLEHIPDLIGFLHQVDALLKPDGVISLAMPDMRFCFDVFKTLTMTSHVLGAHREQRTRHTPETLFEAQAYQAWSSRDEAAWMRDVAPSLRLVCPLEAAYDIYVKQCEIQAKSVAPYVDAHAWVFTPSSFQLLFLELMSLKITPFGVTDIMDAEGGEFMVQLRRGSPPVGTDALQLQRVELLNKMVEELAVRSSLMVNRVELANQIARGKV